MRSRMVVRLIVACTILVLPVMAHAQEEAVVSGRVTDSSGGVLPGVTVRAVHVATGNAFEAVTDGLGAYRMRPPVAGTRLTQTSMFTPPTLASGRSSDRRPGSNPRTSP